MSPKAMIANIESTLIDKGFNLIASNYSFFWAGFFLAMGFLGLMAFFLGLTVGSGMIKGGLSSMPILDMLITLRREKQSLQYTSLSPLGLNGIVHSFLQSAQMAVCMTLAVLRSLGLTGCWRLLSTGGFWNGLACGTGRLIKVSIFLSRAKSSSCILLINSNSTASFFEDCFMLLL